LAPKVGVEPTT